MDSRGRSPRLLDDDRAGADARLVRGPAGRLRAAARDGRRLWRAAHLCLAPLHHVLAAILLLLRPAEEELSGDLRFPRPRGEGAADSPRGRVVEVQAGA